MALAASKAQDKADLEVPRCGRGSGIFLRLAVRTGKRINGPCLGSREMCLNKCTHVTSRWFPTPVSYSVQSPGYVGRQVGRNFGYAHFRFGRIYNFLHAPMYMCIHIGILCVRE